MSEVMLQQFEKHWEDFTASLRGNLSRSKKLGYHDAAQALETARIDWIARDTVYGRWFLQLDKENPQIAQTVAEILTQDMKFTECKETPDCTGLLQYVVPVAGAGMAGMSYHFLAQSATLLKSAAIPVVTAGVLFAATKQAAQNMAKARTQKLLGLYMDQLTIYHDSVVAALKA